MSARTDRLKKLLDLQEKLKAFHETRHAGFLAAANAAQADADEIAARFDSPNSLAMLFPETYSKHFSESVRRAQASKASAAAEAQRLATATARTNTVRDNWQVSRRADERKTEERDSLEAAQRPSPKSWRG